MSMWSSEKVLKLIEDYHASPCLWDVTSPHYKNRIRRREAVETLALKHDVTVSDIEKKLHSLKSSFCRERKKNPRESTWFAYEHLLFLLPTAEYKGGRHADFDETDLDSGNNIDGMTFFTGHPKEEQRDADEEGEEDIEEEEEDPFKTLNNPPKRFRRKIEHIPAHVTVKCMKTLSKIVESKDEHSIYGEYVTNKLKHCNRSKLEIFIAQHHISHILYQLEMGLLAAEIPPVHMPDTVGPM